MNPDELSGTLRTLAVPLFGLAVAALATRRRKLRYREDLGFVAPSPKALSMGLIVWALWVAIGEWAIARFGLADAVGWPAMSGLAVAIRIVAIGLLGPILEELLFRGIFFFWLARTRIGALGAVLVTSVVWAAFHYRYGVASTVLIVGSGILLGTLRIWSRSIWVPIICHIGGNLFSIAQSLTR